MRRPAIVSLAALLAGCALLGAAGCGSSTPAADSGARGNVAVLYAGSLVNAMERDIGPRFEASTRYGFEGFPGGSMSLAHQIAGEIRRGDVLVSASPTADRALQGAARGDWVRWYATFARSPLLIAYSPQSRFASQLRDRPWWRVVTEPGFRLGRTDPRLDPKGALIVQALDRAAREHHDPALRRLAEEESNVFPEESLVGRLQSGQLDAGFFYSVEADAARPRLPTVSIAPIGLSAAYTVTVLRGAPNRAGAVAFVRFLLSPRERPALRRAGLTPTAPVITGSRSSVPAGLAAALSPRSSRP